MEEFKAKQDTELSTTNSFNKKKSVWKKTVK